MFSASPSILTRYGHFLFRYRNLVFPLLLLILVLLFPPNPLAGNVQYDLWMNVAGILIIICGQVMRAGVIGLAYIKRGGVNKKIHAEKLVKEGIFSHCRNPLYVGNLLILSGFLIIHNNPWVYIYGGSFFIISYQAIVLAEESFLRSRFGDEFDEYCKNVNRWVISFSGLGKTLGSMKFNWRRVIIKDYTTMLTWFLTVILLLIREHIARYGINYSWSFISQMLFPVVLAVLLSVVVRTLKKNGTLVS